jgi:hypothetical protein
MLDTTRIHVRFAQGIPAVAAAAALLVPAASAAPLITDTLAPGGSASASGSRFITDTLAPGGGSVSVDGYRFVTDTLALGGSPAPAIGYRFITDTLAPGGGSSAVVSVPAGNGFSWADGGIGALMAWALMLLALTGRHIVSRRRRGQLVF